MKTRKQKKAQRVKSRAYKNALIKAAQTAEKERWINEVKDFPYKTNIYSVSPDGTHLVPPFKIGRPIEKVIIIYPELSDWLDEYVGQGNWFARIEKGHHTFYFKDELNWLLFKLSEWC